MHGFIVVLLLPGIEEDDSTRVFRANRSLANFAVLSSFLEGRHLEGMATVGACLRQIGLLDTSVFTACDNIDEEFKIVKKTYHKTILQCVPALPAFAEEKAD